VEDGQLSVAKQYSLAVELEATELLPVKLSATVLINSENKYAMITSQAVTNGLYPFLKRF